MSVKTAQRYMALAKKWDSLGAMLADVPNLWSAYQAAGVVPVPIDEDDTTRDSDPAGDRANPSGGQPADNLSQLVAGFSNTEQMRANFQLLVGMSADQYRRSHRRAEK